jgi:DNA recombination-dependent growth factor C
MFFKNAIQYLTAAELPPLEARKFRNPTPKELSFTGFAPVEDDLYVVNGLFCLRHAEKIIPASAVNYRVEQLAAGRKVSKDELNAMKESVIREAAVHALVKVTDIYAYLGGGKLIINTASHNTAERVVSHLRALSGTFAVEKMPELELERIFNESTDFEVLENAVFVSDDAKVVYKGNNVYIARFGKTTKLALSLKDTIFTVSEKFVLSKIKMTDVKPEDLRNDIALSIGVINEITRALNETLHNL